MDFSPYQPPPDAQRENETSKSGLISGKGKAKGVGGKRPWFSRDASSYQAISGGYQSGGSLPDPSASYKDAYAYDPASLESGSGAGPSAHSSSGGFGNGQASEPVGNVWESKIGLRVDVMAGLAYLGGPAVALLLLIFETTNDYVRFHAYQSALLTTPLLVLWLLMTLIGFWRWLRRAFLFFSLALTAYTAFRAFKDPTTSSSSLGMGVPSSGYLPRYYLPIIGDWAEKWVGEE